MTHEEFDKVVEEELDYVKSLLCSKSKEYDFGKDRFHSFKVGGQLQGISQEKCLLGYACKHVISIYDLCNHVEDFSFDIFKEKITDYINYGLLLLGMIKEEKSKETTTIDDIIPNSAKIPSGAKKIGKTKLLENK